MASAFKFWLNVYKSSGWLFFFFSFMQSMVVLSTLLKLSRLVVESEPMLCIETLCGSYKKERKREKERKPQLCMSIVWLVFLAITNICNVIFLQNRKQHKIDLDVIGTKGSNRKPANEPIKNETEFMWRQKKTCNVTKFNTYCVLCLVLQQTAVATAANHIQLHCDLFVWCILYFPNLLYKMNAFQRISDYFRRYDSYIRADCWMDSLLQ